MNGNGGGCEPAFLVVASGLLSTAKEAAAMTSPPMKKKPKAQRHESDWVISAPISGPLKAAMPQTADMTPNNCGQMARANSRSTET